jgi:uncharacterized Zn finger protein
MPLRKVEHPSRKSFYWACDQCPYESQEIRYTRENYHDAPPRTCPRCGTDANPPADSLPASIMADLAGFTNCPGCGRILTASDIVRETVTEKLIHCIKCDYEGTVKKQGESAKPAKV